MPKLTVTQLITQLAQLPPDAHVVMEGCGGGGCAHYVETTEVVDPTHRDAISDQREIWLKHEVSS